MRRHEAGIGGDLIALTHVPQPRLHFVRQEQDITEQEPFPVQVGTYVTSRMVHNTLELIAGYDQLTVGSARDHAAALREKVIFGSGVVVLVEKAPQSEQEFSQPETLPISDI